MEPNLPEKEGSKYGYAVFKQIPDIYVDSSRHEPALAVDESNTDVTIMKRKIVMTKKLNFHSVQNSLFMEKTVTHSVLLC